MITPRRRRRNQVDAHPPRKSIAEIDRILDRMQQGMDAELAAGVPGTIRQWARAAVANQVRPFRLAIPDDAKASLEAHVRRLVHDCVEVLRHTPEGV